MTKKQLILIGILIGIDCCICNVISWIYNTAPIIYVLKISLIELLPIFCIYFLPGTILAALLGFYIVKRSKKGILITVILILIEEIISALMVFSRT
jgi:hypothetical protein